MSFFHVYHNWDFPFVYLVMHSTKNSLRIMNRIISLNDSTSVFYRAFYACPWASLVAQMVKRLYAMLETRVQSLGWEDPLEKEMATHSSTLAWKIPWTEEPGRLQSVGSQRVRHD